jgi:hypothetical protein
MRANDGQASAEVGGLLPAASLGAVRTDEHRPRRKTGAVGIHEQARSLNTNRASRVAKWPQGAMYGFIGDDDGQTWFASIWETRDHARLAPGTPVTFAGDPSPPPGKTYPAATAIVPDPP